MPPAHKRPAEALARLLLPIRDPHPPARAPRYATRRVPLDVRVHARISPRPFPPLLRPRAPHVAICWPATHFTLTLFDHEVRPLVCWAAIGTTTCCSRSVQLWVTSNIVPAPASASAATPHPYGPHEEEVMRRGRRRVWDWERVLRTCALPAGAVYFVMAWALVLRRDVLGC